MSSTAAAANTRRQNKNAADGSSSSAGRGAGGHAAGGVGMEMEMEMWTWGSNGSGELARSLCFTASSSSSGDTDTDSAGAGSGPRSSSSAAAAEQLGGSRTDDGGSKGDTTLGTRIAKPGYVSLGNGVFAQSVCCGQGHTVALDTVGRVWAWGANEFGQLGLGTRIAQSEPQPVDSLEQTVKMIGCGFRHTVALTHTAQVYTWGEGAYGKLGLGTFPTCMPSPMCVETLPRVKEIFVGAHQNACVDEDNGVYTWGWNGNGQLAHGFMTDPLSGLPTPTRIGDINKRVVDHIDRSMEGTKMGEQWDRFIAIFKDVVDGETDKLAKELLRVHFQRSENYTKKEEQVKMIKDVVRLGAHDELSSRLLELLVKTFHVHKYYQKVQHEKSASDLIFSQIAIGERHMAAITPEGELYSWGCNLSGQLGRATEHADSPLPAQVDLHGVTFVSCGLAHTAAVQGGSVFSWGHNEAKRLGYESPATQQKTPKAVIIPLPASQSITSVSCGEFHTMAVTNTGRVWAWGYNNYGQLGNPITPDEVIKPVGHPPTMVATLEDVQGIICGNTHNVALLRSANLIFQLCRDNNLQMVQTVSQAVGAGRRDSTGKSPLHHAVIYGNLEIAQYLVCHENLDAADNQGATALHCSIESRTMPCTKLLVQSGCALNIATTVHSDTPLHLAAKAHYFDVVQFLVMAGAAPNLSDSEGKTPLQYLTSAECASVNSLIESADIVIICAPAEQTFSSNLATALRNYRFKVWADDTPPGSDSDPSSISSSAVARRITRARVVIWVVSNTSVLSERCRRHLQTATQLSKLLFPIWFHYITHLPPDVEHLIFRTQLVNFSGSITFKEALAKLVEGIQNALEGRTTVKVDTDAEPTLSPEELQLETSKMETLMSEISSKPYIFMCYHWSDKTKVQSLMDRLSQYHFLCYPGSNKVHDVARISSVIIGSSIFVLCLSRRSVNNPDIRNQLALAENKNIIMFPVHFQKKIPVDPGMQYTLARAPSFVYNRQSPDSLGTLVAQLSDAITLSTRVQTSEASVVTLGDDITATTNKVAEAKQTLARLRSILAEMERTKKKNAKAHGVVND
ncbi:chromosome condensation regulator [Pelomyxa schiedti]|nr:chromosome condensation regulator [Pelomyxa schiedti]